VSNPGPTGPVPGWRWTSELFKGNSGALIHESEVPNALLAFQGVVRFELQPLECFPSVAVHINSPGCTLFLPLAFVRKHVSKSRHGCSCNKTAKVLHFTGCIFGALSLLLWGKCFIVPPCSSAEVLRQQKQWFGPERKKELTGGKEGRVRESRIAELSDFLLNPTRHIRIH